MSAAEAALLEHPHPKAKETPMSQPTVNYIIPFSALKNDIKLVSLKGQLKVDLTYDEFLAILRQVLQAAPVDEAWYRTTYPDVAEAVDAGTYKSCKQHFVANGYLEGRRPFDVTVDEAWYLSAYPDVKEGIAEGLFASAQEHFSRHGYEEGRRPTG
jgi:hypothetical protein